MKPAREVAHEDSVVRCTAHVAAAPGHHNKTCNAVTAIIERERAALLDPEDVAAWLLTWADLYYAASSPTGPVLLAAARFVMQGELQSAIARRAEALITPELRERVARLK